ncbi:hypothetical protein ACNKHS_09780 [Shigella flexneri]
MVFRIASSPYTHNQRQTSRIMMLVSWPRCRASPSCWFLAGARSFQLHLAVASAVTAEAAILKLRQNGSN